MTSFRMRRGCMAFSDDRRGSSSLLLAPSTHVIYLYFPCYNRHMCTNCLLPPLHPFTIIFVFSMIPACICFTATETEIFFAWMQRTMPTARALPYGIQGDQGFHTMSSTVREGGKGGGGRACPLNYIVFATHRFTVNWLIFCRKSSV